MGEVFAGRYELIAPIADGGMGSVWQVLDHRDGQTKAAKILRQSDAGSLLRFIREQSVRIEHDHVVTPDSWGGADDRVVFTMPLVRGGSVADLVGDFGALPIAWTAEILDQTLQALTAVHGAGYVHRDVKPANLLLDPTGAGRPHVRLSGFGIAAPLDQPRLTRASQVVGSPGYLAPEQLRGADPDPRQDVYGVGIVGLELITGLRPPDCLESAATSSDPLVDLLRAAVAEDPRVRPADATELRARLAALGLPGFPASADPDGPFVFDHFAEPPADDEPTAPKPVDRTRLVGVTLLVLAAACLVVAVTLVL